MPTLIHCFRVGTVAALAILVFLGQQRDRGPAVTPLETIPMVRIRQFLPAAAHVAGASAAIRGGRTVVDDQGKEIGAILQTAPDGSRAIGFSGPTNLLIVCDTSLTVVGVDLLSSSDTRDHVAAVVHDNAFWGQFRNAPLGQLTTIADQPHATAGATLTSLAIADAIRLRLGAEAPLARFPNTPTLADYQQVFPTAARYEGDPGEPSVTRLYDHHDIPLGWTLRTSPHADDVVGYQGPTDVLVGFDAGGRACGLLLLSSFDNEPYVGYVRDDAAFRAGFLGRTFEELSRQERDGVEGVSGATMTSQAIAAAIMQVATAEVGRRQGRVSTSRAFTRWIGSIEPAQWGALAVIAVGLSTAVTRWRGGRWGRLALPLIVLAYLGYGAGAVLSQAQLWGWAAHGIPTGATVLLFLTGVAVLTPITTGRNVYCTHLCAHGAAQQLLARTIRPHQRLRLQPLRAGLTTILIRLRWLPAGLLAVAVLSTSFKLPLHLVDLEPFDAYLPTVAGVAAITIFVLSLLASSLVPLAYCRTGCPTGHLLNALRRPGRNARLTWNDAVLILLLIGSACSVFMPTGVIQ